MNAQFGDDLVDHYTYVIVGDGCLMEGISQEALTLAGHLKLNKLIVFWDNNSISIDGPVSLSDSTDQVARFKAVRLERQPYRRPRSRGNRRRDRGRPKIRPADADRRQDHDRLRRADQGRHQGSAWLAAGRGRDRRRPKGARLGFAAFRNPCRHPVASGAGPARCGAKPRAEWEKRLTPSRRQTRRVRAPHRAANCRTISMRRSPTTSRSSPPTSRRSRPANPRKWRWKSSTARCPRPSAARPT